MKEGWNTRNLGDVCQVIGGGTPSKDRTAYYSGDIPWATVRDMRQEVISETEFKITKEAVRSSSTNIIPEGNVVIATRVGLGKVCMLGQDTAINQDLRGIIPNNPKILLVRFLFWWFKSIEHLIEEEGTGATVKGVKLPFIKSLQIPLPSLSEQQRIVTILDDASTAIAKAKENAEKYLQHSRDLAESYLQTIFAKPGDGWEEKQLRALISEMMTGPFGSMLHKSDYVPNGVPVINPQNIVNGSIIPLQTTMVAQQTRERLSKYILKERDLVVARRGEMGRCAIVNKGQVGWLCGTGSLVIRVKKDVDEKYLAIILSSAKIKSILENDSIGATMSNLNQGILLQIKIPLPSLPEQHTIVAKLESLSAETKKLITINKQKLANLDELKKSILQKAFSDELSGAN